MIDMQRPDVNNPSAEDIAQVLFQNTDLLEAVLNEIIDRLDNLESTNSSGDEVKGE